MSITSKAIILTEKNLAKPGSPEQGLEHIIAVIGRKIKSGRPVTCVRTYCLFANLTAVKPFMINLSEPGC